MDALDSKRQSQQWLANEDVLHLLFISDKYCLHM